MSSKFVNKSVFNRFRVSISSLMTEVSKFQYNPNEHFINYSEKCKEEHFSRDKYKWRSVFLTGLGCFGFYFIYKRINSFATVHAISKDSLRNKYNFIADVVEKSANAVVFIEMKYSRVTDLHSKVPFTVSNGAGFIISEDGLILTNAHVVNNPPRIVKVKLTDGRCFEGVVEDTDIKSDLALVRIKANKLPVMKLGSSCDIRPGEWVVAIGSPLALSNSITAGVISSVNRPSMELGLRNRDIEYIQTDASITFGNSGGPLVNLDGEAIGINAMKLTPGISFAIPIDHAKEFLKKSEERRRNQGSERASSPRRRYMGISMMSLTQDLLLELQVRNMTLPLNLTGVLVFKVVIGSPAFQGGLRPGDIVTHINGTPVEKSSHIYAALEKSEVLRLSVVRGGSHLELTVVPEDI